MSYDVDFYVDLGGGEESYLQTDDYLNYTYNVSPMFYRALGAGGLTGLNRLSCKSAIPRLRLAIRRMENNPGLYRSMNPPNGWGDYEGALEFLRRILRQCERHPGASFHIT